MQQHNCQRMHAASQVNRWLIFCKNTEDSVQLLQQIKKKQANITNFPFSCQLPYDSCHDNITVSSQRILQLFNRWIRFIWFSSSTNTCNNYHNIIVSSCQRTECLCLLCSTSTKQEQAQKETKRKSVFAATAFCSENIKQKLEQTLDAEAAASVNNTL